jgi:general secretion pathway protein G
MIMLHYVFKIFTKLKSNGLGFTLIELLVVISIIGLLAGMVLVSMSGVRAQARDTRRKADLFELAKALEMYYQRLTQLAQIQGKARGCAGAPQDAGRLAPEHFNAEDGATA